MAKKQEELLTEALAQIYCGVLQPTGWGDAMRATARLFSASHATLQLVNPTDSTRDVVRTHGFDPVYHEEFVRRRDEDFWLQRGLRNPGRILTGTELISPAEMRKRPLYHELLRPMDVEYVLGAIVPGAGRGLVVCSFLRSIREDNFGDLDKDMLARLLPHLVRAFALRQHFEALSGVVGAYEQALDGLKTAVVLLDERGRVLQFNRRMEILLARSEGVTISAGRIRLWLPALSEALRGEVARCCASRKIGLGAPGAAITMPMRSGAGRLQFVVSSVVVELSAGCPLDRVACIVAITEATTLWQPSAPEMMRAYGLTAAEAQVAMLITAGKSAAEIAGQRSVSMNTVRTQLKVIFRKCGVRSQSALVRELIRHSRQPGC